ncbi:MAG: hypothetical protein A2017_03710 [Lentisphaerae bacterium GWF2_44_16]|nr:MAG: hypothetical protein A2017_03710 [Lentisphaerae bacterium GWF2_44_16]
MYVHKEFLAVVLKTPAEVETVSVQPVCAHIGKSYTRRPLPCDNLQRQFKLGLVTPLFLGNMDFAATPGVPSARKRAGTV